VKPIRLAPNQLHRFYRGGAAIGRFRGVASPDEYAPEDWVGSTTTAFGDASAGLSSLPDGRLLRDALASDPLAFLRPAHVERFGADPALLVKLLDAGERLPVHCHPDRSFARRHLDSAFGKTEAWVIVAVRGERPAVHLGFRDGVDAETLERWVSGQETESLLGSLHEVLVAPGDCLFVPAGVPHAIGEGVFLVELQEPSDLSVLLEWEGFAGDGARDGHLGLGFEVALAAVDRSAVGTERLAGLRHASAEALELRPGVRALLPPEADPFFRGERLRPDPAASLEQDFSILVVLEGEGRLETERGGAVPLARGDTLLVPYAAGAGELTGAADIVRCLPPLPTAGD
jgi:mannose-6-phosphate isomerase